MKKWKNHGEISKIQPFIDKHNWEGKKYSSEKDEWKNLRKIIPQMLLMVCILKKENISCLSFKT